MKPSLPRWMGQHSAMPYLLAAVAALIVAGLRIVLAPLTGVGAPWVVFFTAVALVALYLGRGPALFATLISASAGMWLFVLPAGHSPLNALAQSVLWILDGVLISHMAMLLKRRHAEAMAAATALRQSEQRLRLATAAANIGLYEIDLVTHTVVGSAELHALIGTPPGPVSLEQRFQAVHADDLERARKAFEQSLDPAGDGSIKVETRILRPDGGTRWLDWVGCTLFEDTPSGRRPIRQIGVGVDVTPQRLVELELRRLNENKDLFLAHLSHELRNPLAAIRSGITILEHAPPNTEMAVRSRCAIDRQVAQLTRLTDDLLDVTRIARGKLVMQRKCLDLGPLVATTLEDQRPFVESHCLDLTALRECSQEPIWVNGDSARLTQILHNLIHNAVKFTPPGGRITVVLGRDDTAAILRVRDTGSGLSASDTSKIFEPFVQLGPSKRAEAGLGLGLALVRGIVEQHGGSVTATSAGLGRGTELTVRLPIAAAPEASVPAPAPAPSIRRRVLVIDDHPDVISTLHDVLELLGHDVKIAMNGRDGVAMAGEIIPDIVLCDIGLPDIDGYEVSRQLRQNAALRNTSLVALSGFGLPEDHERARKAGFARLIAKPASIDVLKQLLAQGA